MLIWGPESRLIISVKHVKTKCYKIYFWSPSPQIDPFRSTNVHVTVHLCLCRPSALYNAWALHQFKSKNQLHNIIYIQQKQYRALHRTLDGTPHSRNTNRAITLWTDACWLFQCSRWKPFKRQEPRMPTKLTSSRMSRLTWSTGSKAALISNIS